MNLASSDISLKPSQWSDQVIGKISSWIDLESEDEVVRKNYEITLRQEIDCASRLSLQACVLPASKGSSCANYIRCVSQILQNLSSMQLWLKIPIEKSDNDTSDGNSNVWGGLQTDSWELWNSFHLLCQRPNLLSVTLDVSRSSPSADSLGYWFGEPVKAAIIHLNSFLTDAQGHPCLSKCLQKLMAWLFSRSIQVVISGMPVHHIHPETLFSSATNANTQDEGPNSAVQHPCVEGKVLSLIFLHSAPRLFMTKPQSSNCMLNSCLSANNIRQPFQPYLEYVAYLHRWMRPLLGQERFEDGIVIAVDGRVTVTSNGRVLKEDENKFLKVCDNIYVSLAGRARLGHAFVGKLREELVEVDKNSFVKHAASFAHEIVEEMSQADAALAAILAGFEENGLPQLYLITLPKEPLDKGVAVGMGMGVGVAGSGEKLVYNYLASEATRKMNWVYAEKIIFEGMLSAKLHDWRTGGIINLLFFNFLGGIETKTAVPDNLDKTGTSYTWHNNYFHPLGPND